ncbi:MAG: Uma2 family endonuclease [Paludisphaera borealis]|uniref:Uma2 family endonuclease n=1 Tax=Paludisphaera borealis TaxID=1387353 RepID=UPI00283CB58B|nr:Uma2 family endonuclease [Paludisphaera borealis]MDR3621943.1 Uma2 family endonuclease [Paludisphaera borealis]
MSRIPKSAPRAIVYPDRDGRRIADNTLQYQWIVTIEGNLELLFADRPDVFVAGDLLWYAVEGQPNIRTAPDALVAIGRPKGYRGSYKQWEEGGVAPQVVFEVLSHGNRAGEMGRKLEFYDRYGVQEYYLYDPNKDILKGYRRSGGELAAIDDVSGWTSPLLKIRFDCSTAPMTIRYPDGRPFLTFQELGEERNRAVRERDRERERADRLAAKLRELGIDVD